MVGKAEVRLMLLKNGEVVEDELWRPNPQIGREQSMEVAKALFDDCYDAVNYLANNRDT